MTQDIYDFINSKQTCVLAFEMLDGSPHASTVHAAFDSQSEKFFFETYSTYRKAEVLFAKKEVRASLVIGFDESDQKTLQVDGVARLITLEEKELYDKIYFEKFPKKKEKSVDPKFVFFSFEPTWWRFTNWAGKNGKEILTSEDK